jgi:hypothetical protein
MATVEELHYLVSSEDPMKDLEANHDIKSRDMIVEVSAPPTDLWLQSEAQLNALICSGSPSPALC